MINVELLRNKISDCGYTLESVAGVCGIDRATLYRRLMNDSLRVKDVHRICDYLHLTSAEALCIFLPYQSHI